MYEYEILYYIVIEPRNEGAFRPVILDYGVYFDKATEIMRDYINDYGLKFKGKPCHLYIKQTVTGLPKGYTILRPHLEPKEIVSV